MKNTTYKDWTHTHKIHKLDETLEELKRTRGDRGQGVDDSGRLAADRLASPKEINKAQAKRVVRRAIDFARIIIVPRVPRRAFARAGGATSRDGETAGAKRQARKPTDQALPDGIDDIMVDGQVGAVGWTGLHIHVAEPAWLWLVALSSSRCTASCSHHQPNGLDLRLQ
ncbi:MAG: hypothetical protein M1826_002526 [Phylliscum demangeonii]|nr:MAG: hypothetical protein M1826_002526 [Phylliscum demangeonii]